jgi:hypothetical protein
VSSSNQTTPCSLANATSNLGRKYLSEQAELRNHSGREVARHERLHGKYATSAQLDHYLELLARKPGALEHSVALAQERDRGGWPDCFDQLRAALRGRYGRSDAARQMVDVLLLCRDHGPAVVELAVRGALAAGARDGRAVAAAGVAPCVSRMTPGRLTRSVRRRRRRLL